MDKLPLKKVLLMLGLFALAAAAYSLPLDEFLDPRPADLDLSAIRYIQCDGWSGTGFLIGDRILVTALHVGSGKHCFDGATGAKLSVYKKDEAHDLALMTGRLPTDLPYIKYTCDGYKKNEGYFAYGITSWGQSRLILRMNSLTFTGTYTDGGFLIRGMEGGLPTPSPGLAYFKGYVAPGMSGGPVVDKLGYAHSLVNASNNKNSESYEFKDGLLCSTK